MSERRDPKYYYVGYDKSGKKVFFPHSQQYERNNGTTTSLKSIRLSVAEASVWDSKEIHDFLAGKYQYNQEDIKWLIALILNLDKHHIKEKDRLKALNILYRSDKNNEVQKM